MMDSSPVAQAQPAPPSGEPPRAPPPAAAATATPVRKPSVVSGGAPLYRVTPPRRVCRRGTRPLSRDDVTLADFVEEKILKPGQELRCVLTTQAEAEKAWLTKDGWLADECDETHPTVEHWLAKAARRHELRMPSGDPWTFVVTAANMDRSLAELRDAYVAWKSTDAGKAGSLLVVGNVGKKKGRKSSEVAGDEPFDTQDARYPELDVATVEDSVDETFVPPTHTPATVEEETQPSLGQRYPSTVSEPTAKMTERDDDDDDDEDDATVDTQEMQDDVVVGEEKKKKRRKSDAMAKPKKRRSSATKRQLTRSADAEEPDEKSPKQSQEEQGHDGGWLSKQQIETDQGTKKKKNKKKTSQQATASEKIEEDEAEDKPPAAIVIQDSATDMTTPADPAPATTATMMSGMKTADVATQAKIGEDEMPTGSLAPTLDLEWLSKKPTSPPSPQPAPQQQQQPVTTPKPVVPAAQPTPPNPITAPSPPKPIAASSPPKPVASSKPVVLTPPHVTKATPAIPVVAAAAAAAAMTQLTPTDGFSSLPPSELMHSPLIRPSTVAAPAPSGERTLSGFSDGSTLGEIVELNKKIEERRHAEVAAATPAPPHVTSPPKKPSEAAAPHVTSPPKKPSEAAAAAAATSIASPLPTGVTIPAPVLVSVSAVPEKKDKAATGPRILPSNLKSELLVHLSMAIRKMGGRTVDAFAEDSVTHVVLDADEDNRARVRTTKLAQGIATGKWVVSFKWVLDSFGAGRWLDETTYEITSDPHCLPNTGAARMGRLRAKAGDPPLFAGHRFFISPTVEAGIALGIAEVIAAAGGEVLRYTPAAPSRVTEVLSSGSAATHVLAPPATTVEQAKLLYLQCGRRPISCDWPLDCVSRYKVLPTKGFELAIAFGDELAGLATQHSLAY